MRRSFRMYHNSKLTVSVDVDSSLEFSLRHSPTVASDTDIPQYQISQGKIPYLGVDDKEYLLFHSEKDARITVVQPVQSGKVAGGALVASEDIGLQHGAVLFSYDEKAPKGIDKVYPPALLWKYHSTLGVYLCGDAIEGEEYVLYLITSVIAKAGVIPMARRAEVIVNLGGCQYTYIFCDSPTQTQFYFGPEV